MARHEQRHGDIIKPCPNCAAGDCTKCVDVIRVIYASSRTCPHDTKAHHDEVISKWTAKSK